MDDSYLILKLREGSHESFNALYSKYKALMENFAYSLTKDRDAAKEITQDVFIRLWEYRKKLDDVKSFKSYVFKMTSNQVYDYYKKRSSKTVLVSVEQLGNFQEITGLVPPPDIDSRDLLILVRLAVGTLPEQRRKVFMMSRWLGMSNKEIAESQEIALKTVEYHISAALADLRKILDSQELTKGNSLSNKSYDKNH